MGGGRLFFTDKFIRKDLLNEKIKKTTQDTQNTKQTNSKNEDITENEKRKLFKMEKMLVKKNEEERNQSVKEENKQKIVINKMGTLKRKQ